MLATPTVPPAKTPDLLAAWGVLPLRFEVSSLALVTLLVLAGIFVAAISVVLIYHWRRFPFEHQTFRWAERIYLFGVFTLLGAAVIGILLS
jgi:hypothetical protein